MLALVSPNGTYSGLFKVTSLLSGEETKWHNKTEPEQNSNSSTMVPQGKSTTESD